MKRLSTLIATVITLIVVSIAMSPAAALPDGLINNVVVKPVNFSKQSQGDTSYAQFDAILGITKYIGVSIREDNMSLDSDGVAAFSYYLYDERKNLILQRIFLVKGEDYQSYKQQGNQYVFDLIAERAGLVFDN